MHQHAKLNNYVYQSHHKKHLLLIEPKHYCETSSRRETASFFSHLRLPCQLLEEVVRLELFPLLLVGEDARYLEVDARHLVSVVVAVVVVAVVVMGGGRGSVVVVMVVVVHGRGRS